MLLQLSATVAMLQRENEGLKAALERERAAKEEADATIRALQELLREARAADASSSSGRGGERSAPTSPTPAAGSAVCSACGAGSAHAIAALTARPALALSPQLHITERMRLTGQVDAAPTGVSAAVSLATGSSPSGGGAQLIVKPDAGPGGAAAPIATASFSLASRLKGAGSSSGTGSAPGSVMVAILPPATRSTIGSRIADWLQEASAASPSIDSLAAAEEAEAGAAAADPGSLPAGRSRGGLRTLTISTSDGAPTASPSAAGDQSSAALSALHDLVSRMRLRNLSEAYAAVDQMLAPLVQAVNACAQAVAECEHERATAAASASTIASLRALAARHEREAGVWESKYARLLRDYDDLNRAAVGMSQTMQTLQASIDDLRMRAPPAPAAASSGAAADGSAAAVAAAAPSSLEAASDNAGRTALSATATGPVKGLIDGTPLSAASSASSLMALTHAASSASLAAQPVADDAGRATPVAAPSPLAAVAAETAAAAAGSAAAHQPPGAAATSSSGSSRSIDAAAHPPRDAARGDAPAPPRPAQLQPSPPPTMHQQHASPPVDGSSAATAVRDMLVAGALFVKHGRMGRPHLRYVWCDGDLLGIHWRAIGSGRTHTGKGSMPLASVLDVVPGRNTAVFARNSGGHSGRDQACFSLVAADRTLDLEVEWQGGSAGDSTSAAATASAAGGTASASASTSSVTPADISQRDAWVEALKCLVSAWKLVKRAAAQADGAAAPAGAAGALPIDDADVDSDADGSSVGSSHVSRLPSGLGSSPAAVSVMDALAVVMARKQRASGVTISPASSSSMSSAGRTAIGIDRFRAGAPFPPLGGAAGAAGLVGRSRGGDASFESMRSSIDGLEATWVSEEGAATER